MSKKLFNDRRWTDLPQAKVVGYFEMTEEEKRQAGKDLEKILKETGAIKPDETLEELIKSRRAKRL